MWVLSEQGARFEQVKDADVLSTSKIDAGEPDVNIGAPSSAVIELNFPSSHDGRGFSLARRLRRQHGQSMRIVASGNLIPDQARMAFQCGFDEIRLEDDLVARHSQQAWRNALSDAATDLYVSSRANRLAQQPGWDSRHQPSVKVKSLTSRESFEELQKLPQAKILDVRTPAELNFVGRVSFPNTVEVAWKSYPEGAKTPNFTDLVEAAGLTKNCPIFVLCRSGVRSLDAANALKDAGFKDLTNISDGFEGDLNALNRRGSINGWKASGLPWHQQ